MKKILPLTIIMVFGIVVLGTVCQSCQEWPCSSLQGDFSISSTDGYGKTWDKFGPYSAPDPKGQLTVRRNGTMLAHGTERIGLRQDTLEFIAPFFARHGITLHPGDIISIRVVDDDATTEEPIGDVSFPVNGRTIKGSSTNGRFNVTLTCAE